MLSDTVSEKTEFVHKYLAPMVKAIDGAIAELEYTCRESNEFVIIRYKCGTNTVVCVSRNSLVTLARDVLKYI